MFTIIYMFTIMYMFTIIFMFTIIYMFTIITFAIKPLPLVLFLLTKFFNFSKSRYWNTQNSLKFPSLQYLILTPTLLIPSLLKLQKKIQQVLRFGYTSRKYIFLIFLKIYSSRQTYLQIRDDTATREIQFKVRFCKN